MDLIDRQAAIDVARKCAVKEVTPAYMLIDKAEAMTELMLLPSIQPEIVRCEECKYHYQRNCPIEKYFSLNGFCSRGKRREVTT